MRALLITTCLIFITACSTPYSLVKRQQKIDINGMSVVSVGAWSQLSTTYTIDNIPTWTADGTVLNSIMFFSNVADGQKLIKDSEKTHFPVFHKNMLPNEVEDLVQSTVTQLYGASILEQGTLKPIKIGSGDTGFQFTFKFAGQDEVPRGLLATGIIKKGHLYLIMYQAADLYYFDKDLPSVEQIMASMNIA